LGSYFNPIVFKKENKFQKLSIDDFIKTAIDNVLSANKQAFEAGKTVDDGLLAKVIAIDDLESLCIGFDIIRLKTENIDSYYSEKCKEFLASEAYLRLPVESLERRAKFAQFRFKLILSSIKKTIPVEVELDF
jgi:hypothetical protein